ncbi:putative short chain dehydrogenase/reductase [Coniella lustricola]|uniref:Putative short chain dehydrogenase/reductase n=1 Tax=Coniella lustricola TaxID=2025994 RepID=A0A2T3ALL9_9PEZI|nr:putative short chain dehydrogenase/reductase [Coniella lustricola]
MAAEKKIVLITGANSGIGLETVVSLSQASPDYHIFLASRNLEKGRKALSDIQSAHGASLQSPISVLQLDVTDAQSIAAAKTHIETSHSGRLDVLISNAGILPLPHDEPGEAKIELLRKTFETNVFAPWLLTDVLEPLLRNSAKAKTTGGKQQSPLLVYVSSAQGSITMKLDPTNEHAKMPGEHYRASKSALNMLAACHRYAFREWGCRVCAFDPGFCVTNLTGEKGRQMRIDHGARSAKDPADELVRIILGERDAHFEENGMMDVDGGIKPW